VNARYLLAGSTLFIGGGFWLLAVAPSLPIALTAVALVGMGYGLSTGAPNYVVAALNPARAGASLNLLNMFYGVGAVIGPQLVARMGEVQNAFGLAALAAFALTVPLALVSVRPPARDTTGEAARGRVNWPAVLPFALVLTLYIGAEIGFANWIPTQLSKMANADAVTAASATSIFWAGLTLGRFTASFALRRLPISTWLLISLGFGALAVGIVLLFPRVEGVGLICSFLVGFACGPTFPSVVAALGDAYPAARGAVVGVVIAIASVGSSIIPIFQGQVGGGRDGGLIVNLIGFLAVMALIAALAQRPVLRVRSVE
jgi:fucose permease